MECKVQKRSVIVINDKDGSPATGQTCASCSRCCSKFISWTNLGLLFVLFVSNIFLHYKCMQISNELSVLQQSQKREIPPLASQLTSSLQNPASVFPHQNKERSIRKRNYRQTRRRRREILNQLEITTQRNRDAISRILSRPAIHMRGSDGAESDAVIQNRLFSTSERTTLFRWNHQDPSYPNPSFQYVNEVQDSTKILAVNITNPGLYLIYSQVVIKGPYSGFDPAYGVETVRRRQSLPPEVLLRSYVTQDGRGSAYPNMASNTTTRYPVDFINHIGMFELQCDDIIYVRIPSQSSHGNYLRIPEQTYFGLELIKPKISYLEQLYGC
ncbi:uncharacterized protein LOC132545833 [Ylistrum balloti]|uniref:uncharacterized protein LOC132545833 n=1 Tax=Ylistrum balloti TaxID=509963 RepID=UPI00290586BD|nr:uncharacterized protein LOC132545833 [Ylistrum balloti]